MQGSSCLQTTLLLSVISRIITSNISSAACILNSSGLFSDSNRTVYPVNNFQFNSVGIPQRLCTLLCFMHKSEACSRSRDSTFIKGLKQLAINSTTVVAPERSCCLLVRAFRKQRTSAMSSSSTLGSPSNSCQTFHSKKFCALALLDVYKPRGVNRKEYVDSIPHKRIEELEAEVCQEAPNKNFARLFGSFGGSHVKINCEVKFESCDPPDLQFNATVIDNSCLYFRAFGALRFISATFWICRNVSFHEIISPNIKELFDRGLIFADLRYKFLGGKISDTSSEKMPSCYKFDTWFFAERGFPNSSDTSIKDLRNWLGDFGNQPPLKVNCRLSLGFSPSEQRFLLRDESIFVIDDITNYRGKVMTDGCGYISVSTTVHYF